MKIYWHLKDIPELKPLRDFDRKEVMAATAGKRLKDPFNLLLLVPALLMVGLGNYLGQVLCPFPYASSVFGGVMGGVAGGFAVLVMNGRGGHHLAEEIRRRGLDDSRAREMPDSSSTTEGRIRGENPQ